MVEKKKSPAGSFFWQIMFPTSNWNAVDFVCGYLGNSLHKPGEYIQVSEISTVLLVIPVLFSSLLLMLLLVALIILVIKIIQGLPSITGWILNKLEWIQKGVQAVSENAVVPVVRPAALLAGIRRIFSKDNSDIQIE